MASPSEVAAAPHSEVAAAPVKPPSTPSVPQAVRHVSVTARTNATAKKATPAPANEVSPAKIMEKLSAVERLLSAKEREAQKVSVVQGHLQVNGPLPADFSERFAQAVAEATGCPQEGVHVLGAAPSKADKTIDEVLFEARNDCVAAVRSQAADSSSKLANGPLHFFLIDKHDDGDEPESKEEPAAAPAAPAAPATPEINTAEMPFGDLEAFGREDTAQELTQQSISESDAMVDQLERAEVAEEKRAVFRALTRLRGAAITSFDGIARSQTGNIDEYARKNQWRRAHPVHHLAKEESDTDRWAFPVQ